MLPGDAQPLRRIPFAKVQSIGNDFVLVDAEAFASEPEIVDFAVQASDRRLGVGSDGLLVIAPPARPGGEVVLRMFNPDGSEDFCGNGLRCAAQYAIEQGWVGAQFPITHLGRLVTVSAAGGLISTVLPPASFRPEDVPLAPGMPELIDSPLVVGGETVPATALSTGSTHLVLLDDQLPTEERFQRISPLLEHHAAFPARTSIMWTQVVGERRLKLRIWERAVGETLGCGSGTSAAAVAYARKSGRTGAIEVANPGGTLTVVLPSWDGPITVLGRAYTVYHGTWVDFRS